jgi:hypothetical protein
MSNKWGIPEAEERGLRAAFPACAYCRKKMTAAGPKMTADHATIEHLNLEGPFYVDDGLKLEDVVIACNSCNASRGTLRLRDWFRTPYCRERNINPDTVAEAVKKYLERKGERP